MHCRSSPHGHLKRNVVTTCQRNQSSRVVDPRRDADGRNKKSTRELVAEELLLVAIRNYSVWKPRSSIVEERVAKLVSDTEAQAMSVEARPKGRGNGFPASSRLGVDRDRKSTWGRRQHCLKTTARGAKPPESKLDPGGPTNLLDGTHRRPGRVSDAKGSPHVHRQVSRVIYRRNYLQRESHPCSQRASLGYACAHPTPGFLNHLFFTFLSGVMLLLPQRPPPSSRILPGSLRCLRAAPSAAIGPSRLALFVTSHLISRA